MIHRFSAKDYRPLDEIAYHIEDEFHDILLDVFRGRRWKMDVDEVTEGEYYEVSGEDEYENTINVIIDEDRISWNVSPVNRNDYLWEDDKNFIILDSDEDRKGDIVYALDLKEFRKEVQDSLEDVLDKGIQLPQDVSGSILNRAEKLLEELTDMDQEGGYLEIDINGRLPYIGVDLITLDEDGDEESRENVWYVQGDEADVFLNNVPLNVEDEAWVAYMIDDSGLI